MCPQASHSGLEQAHPLLIASLIADAGIKGIDAENLASSLPKRKHIKSCTLDAAIASTVCAAKLISKSKYLYLTADKGNNKEMGHFPKIVIWYDEESNTIQEFLLDIDATDKTSEDAARSIVHSLKKLFEEEDIKIHGIVTDSGGGGTLESLGWELQTFGVCSEIF